MILETITILILNVFPPPKKQEGWSTWYGDGNFHGEITATGEEFNPHGRTCASRKIRLNKIVVVINEEGSLTFCRVNDRGPYGATLKNGEWVIMFYKHGMWHTHHKDGTKKAWLNKPGKYRGIMDLSLGTAKRLYSTKSRPPNGNIKILYW